MPASIKLSRQGSKHKPFYRVVVIDKRKAVSAGSVIDTLGVYNPCKNPIILEINKEKTEDWLKKGAQPTETVQRLLKKAFSGESLEKPIKVKKAEEKPAVEEKAEVKPEAVEVKEEKTEEAAEEVKGAAPVEATEIKKEVPANSDSSDSEAKAE